MVRKGWKRRKHCKAVDSFFLPGQPEAAKSVRHDQQQYGFEPADAIWYQVIALATTRACWLLVPDSAAAMRHSVTSQELSSSARSLG